MTRISSEQASKDFNKNGFNIDNLTILRDLLENHKNEINPEVINFCDNDYIIYNSYEVFEKYEIENWLIYSERLFVDDWLSQKWDFLFGGGWSNDINQAIARIDYVIKNGNSPEMWTYEDTF